MKNVTVSIHPFWNFEIDIPGVSVVRWDFESEPPVDRADVVVTSHWATPTAWKWRKRWVPRCSKSAPSATI